MELEEALSLLRAGADGISEWNRRRSGGEAIPNLNNVDLRGANLAGASLQRIHLIAAILTGADFRGADLEQADLTRANLEAARLDSDERSVVSLKGAILREANLKRANLGGSFLLGADLRGANLESASLQKTNFTGAIIIGADFRGADLDGANLTRANLEEARLDSDELAIVSLKGAILRETNLKKAELGGSFLLGADLRGANLNGASLKGTNLTGAILAGLDLRGARLTGAILRHAKVAQTDFRNADLQDADLREMEGFYTDQLADTSVSGAKLPDEIKSFAALGTVEKACTDARTVFVAMLLGCFYTILTIGTTTDARLITNSSSSPLPIIGTQIPIVGFYVVAPIILFGFYLYFHLCMQNIWERLGGLPAVLPDGRHLDKAADPWLLVGIVQAHFSRLRNERTFLSHVQAALSLFLAWWTVPMTLLLLWLRYLTAHNWLWSAEHFVLLVTSTAVSVYMYRKAVSALSNARQPSFIFRSALRSIAWKRAVVMFSFLVLCYFTTYLSVEGFIFDANIENADVSTKPEGWTGDPSKEKSEILQVKPANLSGVNLRNIRASGAFLVRANLHNADLRDADLRRADLRRAVLSDAHLGGADFAEANLSMADLERTTLMSTQVSNACLDGGTKLPEIKGFDRIKYTPPRACSTLWGFPN